MSLSRRTFMTVPASGVLAGLASAASQAAPDELEKLLKKLEATRAQYYNVPREDGQFLNLLVKTSKSKRVLEIGTANGYSAIWFSLGLQETDGKMTTIEINSRKVKEAKANLKRAGLEHRVTFVEGDAHKEVRNLEGPWDFVFIDAEMGGAMDYFKAVFSKVAKGGLILRHNAIAYKSAMRDYLDAVRKHPELDTVILSMNMKDGFAVSYRKK